DLDKHIAEFDFTPTSLHLANFLKQVFHDELDEAEAKVSLPPAEGEETPSVTALSPQTTVPDARGPTMELPSLPEPPVPDGPPELPPEPGSREITARTNYPGPPGTTHDDDQRTPIGIAGDERVLNVTVSRSEADQLEIAARRNGLTVSALAREILAAWLKFR